MSRSAFSKKCPTIIPAAAALIALGLTAGACGPTFDDRGNLPEKDAVAKIHPGTTTREQIVKLLGTPSSTGVFDDNSWYYISRKTKQISFLDPQTVDQQVYVINFDSNGIVRSVEHKGMKDARQIAMAPGATPAPGRELTFVEQIIGNIGRFNKGESEGGSSGSGVSVSPGAPTAAVGPQVP